MSNKVLELINQLDIRASLSVNAVYSVNLTSRQAVISAADVVFISGVDSDLHASLVSFLVQSDLLIGHPSRPSTELLVL